MCVLLITQLLRLLGRVGSRKRFHHTSWVSVVTRTDRPKSVRIRFVIKVLGGVFVLSLVFSVGKGTPGVNLIRELSI